MPRPLAAPFGVVAAALRDWWRDWVPLAAWNLAWALCWLTVVLGPPATFVLYRVAHGVVHGRGFDVREVPALLRRDFARSWLWLLANLAVGAGLYLNFVYYARLAPPWSVAFGLLSGLVGLGWLAVQFYALPFLMEQARPDLVTALRNAVLTLLASPYYTLVVGGSALLVVALAVRVVAFAFLGLPVLVAVLGAHAVAERLATFGRR